MSTEAKYRVHRTAHFMQNRVPVAMQNGAEHWISNTVRVGATSAAAIITGTRWSMSRKATMTRCRTGKLPNVHRAPRKAKRYNNTSPMANAKHNATA